jgi:hypothetical protein
MRRARKCIEKSIVAAGRFPSLSLLLLRNLAGTSPRARNNKLASGRNHTIVKAFPGTRNLAKF